MDIKPPPKPSNLPGTTVTPAHYSDQTVLPEPLPQQNTPPPPTEPTSSDQPPSALREIFSFVSIIGLALAIAVLMVVFVFRSYQVSGASMQTTLQDQDKLIIWKVPRTWAQLSRHDYVPDRGNVIVFTETNLSQYGQDNTKQLIKRVIGLPGDHVVVKDGQVTIYDQARPGGFQPDKILPYGKVIPFTSGNIDLTLGPHQLFVCGDNRPDSLDSRTFGPINANQVIGKLALRVFPVGQAKVF